MKNVSVTLSLEDWRVVMNSLYALSRWELAASISEQTVHASSTRRPAMIPNTPPIPSELP